jgi:hypothetical protein
MDDRHLERNWILGQIAIALYHSRRRPAFAPAVGVWILSAPIDVAAFAHMDRRLFNRYSARLLKTQKNRNI